MAPMNPPRTTPIVALDVPSVAEALRVVATLGSRCRFYKIGLELFTAAGPAVVAEHWAGSQSVLDVLIRVAAPRSPRAGGAGGRRRPSG